MTAALIGPASKSKFESQLSWQDNALCGQIDPEVFFLEKGASSKDPKRICASCEVKLECLNYALAHDERFGLWGGLSERERRALKIRVPRPTKPIEAKPAATRAKLPSVLERQLKILLLIEESGDEFIGTATDLAILADIPRTTASTFLHKMVDTALITWVPNFRFPVPIRLQDAGRDLLRSAA
jgi:WhiB family redox-sensing transcriptional regulator